MFLCPGIEFKPIEGDALATDWDFGQIGPHLGIEAIPVHSKIGWGIAQAVETRQQALPCWPF
jgi:hypothetical protein